MQKTSTNQEKNKNQSDIFYANTQESDETRIEISGQQAINKLSTQLPISEKWFAPCRNCIATIKKISKIRKIAIRRIDAEKLVHRTKIFLPIGMLTVYTLSSFKFLFGIKDNISIRIQNYIPEWLIQLRHIRHK